MSTENQSAPPAYKEPAEFKRAQYSSTVGSSSWVTSGYAFAPNTSVMDKDNMPSDTAEAARLRTAAVMESLRSGEPGAADKLMGDKAGANAMTPVGWLKRKVSAQKGKGKEGK